MTLSEEFNREKSLPHETNTDNCVDTKEANSNIENLSYGETQVNLLKANFFRKRAIHTPFKKRVQCYHCLTMFSTKGSLRRHLQRLSHKKPSLPVTDVGNLSWKEIKDRIYKDKRKLDDEGKEFINEELEDASIEQLSQEGPQEAECVQKGNKNIKPLYENSRRNKVKKVQEYSCLECGKRFPYRSSLRVHLTIHQDLPRNHNCDLCESSFKTSSALGRHQLTHAEYYEKKFICEQCGKRFTMSTKLKNHMLTHSDLRPYICRICGTSFKRLTHLRSHEQGVHGVTESSLPKNFVCNICGKAMVKQETLSTHMKEHMGELNFKCKKCHKKFVSNTGLNIHLSMGRCENFIMYCAVCQIEFKSDEQVCEHLNVGDEKRKQPKTKDQGTEEKTSNKQRAKKLKLPRHLREKNFVCSVCNKSYIYSCELKTHFRLAHTNEKPFICELCSKAFKTKASLQIHEDVHADLRPYPCYMCQKRFRKSEHLKLHIRTHTGEKPYICQICERGFSQKGDMKKHMLKTHNRPFVNSSSSVTFTS